MVPLLVFGGYMVMVSPGTREVLPRGWVLFCIVGGGRARGRACEFGTLLLPVRELPDCHTYRQSVAAREDERFLGPGPGMPSHPDRFNCCACSRSRNPAKMSVSCAGARSSCGVFEPVLRHMRLTRYSLPANDCSVLKFCFEFRERLSSWAWRRSRRPAKRSDALFFQVERFDSCACWRSRRPSKKICSGVLPKGRMPNAKARARPSIDRKVNDRLALTEVEHVHLLCGGRRVHMHPSMSTCLCIVNLPL